MTKKDRKFIEETINKSVALAIEKNVNGNIREMKANLEQHTKDDRAFQESAKPMLEVFENNRITKMTVRKDIGTITFWAGSAVTIGSLLAGIWYLITHIKIL